jgi:hypothetical protein
VCSAVPAGTIEDFVVKRVLQAIGGEDGRRSDMTTKRLAELDERSNQLKLRMAELHDELAAVQ